MRKTGAVYQVFEAPFDRWEEPPEGGGQTFPGCPTLESFEAQSGLRRGSYVLVEQPKREQTVVNTPEAADVARIADMPGVTKEVQGMLMGKLAKGQQSATAVVAFPTRPSAESHSAQLGQMHAEIAMEDRILTEFKLMLAAYYALYNRGSDASEDKLKVQTVASFILSICPDLAPKLQQAKQSFEAPKFEL